MKNCHVFVCLIFICILFAFPQPVFASGFAIYTQGASALGQGNAVTAHLADPSAVFFNPSLINRLPGTQVQVGTTFIGSSRKFDSVATGLKTSVSSEHYPSTLFVTHQLSPQLSVGFGMFSPYGLGSEWGQTWEGRYISTNSELTTFNFNPVVSWQINPRVSVAAGLDYLIMDSTLEKNIALVPLADGHQKFSGDGDGFGFNLGATIKFTEKATLGLHYRSEIDVDLDGDAEFSLPLGTPAPIAAMLSNSPGATSITLPQQAQVGLAYQLTDNFVAEVGGRWEDWSSFNSLVINLDSGLTTTTDRQWKDVYAFNLGGRYQMNDQVALLFGYLYDNNPAPNQTFDPSIPAADAQIYSIGTEYQHDTWTVSLAYAYQHYSNRYKNNSVGLADGGAANGEYQTDNHMVGLSVGYRFE